MKGRIKEVAFADKKLEGAYKNLLEGKFEDRQLHSWLTRAMEDLRSNPMCGDRVPKKLIPKEYLKKYGVSNLWKYNLPTAWRLTYTIVGSSVM